MNPFGLIVPDQAIWLVCAALYLADNVVLHRARNLVVAETACGCLRPVVPVQRYRLGTRLVTLLSPLLPFRAAWHIAWPPDPACATARHGRALRILNMRARAMVPIRILATCVFASVFLVGPLVTELAGLGFAILVVAPLHATAVLLLAAQLARRRRTRRGMFGVLFECALAPGYFANLCRRMSLRSAPLGIDPLALALAGADPRLADAILNRLALMAEDLAEHGEIGAAELQRLLAWCDTSPTTGAAHG